MRSSEPKFLVYRSAKLAILLRILGFDTELIKEKDYEEAIDIAKKEGRILLSRVKYLRKLPWIYFLKSDDADEQLQQVMFHFQLHIDENKLFSRCSQCNSPLYKVEEEDIRAELPPVVLGKGYEFKKCECCNQCFWKGIHWVTLQDKLKRLNLV